MGQSKLELAVGTGQWDAGLKKAQQSLNSFTNSQGGLQKALEKDNGDMQKFIQMMSKMDSTANTSKGQMNDYKRVLEQLTADYNKMSEAQKKSIGQDYLHTIDALKQKFAQAKQQVDEFNRSLGETSNAKLPDIGGSGGLFGSGKFDGMLQVFGGNLMTKGAGMLAGFASEMGDMIKQGVELAKQGEGIRIAFERLGRGDILNGLREATHGTVTDIELMKAAVKFNDFKLPVEELGTMLAFAQQKAKDTGQSIDYMVDSIVTGLGRKSLMILDNLGLSAAEIKEKMAETGDMTTAVGEIIREQMEKAGDYVETAADRAAQANVNLQNKMEELGRKFAPLQEASNNLWTSMKIGILNIVGGPLTDFINKLTEAGRIAQQYGVLGGSNKVSRMTSNLSSTREEDRQKLYQQQQEKFWRYINPREQQIKDIRAWQRGERGDALQSRISAITEKYGSLDATKIQAEVDAAKKMLSEYQQAAKKILNPVKTDIDTSGAERNVDSLKKKLKELEEQRKKAIASGDTELSKNLLKQINKTKADIRGLDPKALTTSSSHKTTPQETAANKIEEAERTYTETLQKAAIRMEVGLDSTLEGKKKELAAQERLFDAYNDAYATYKDPKYKEASTEAANKIKSLAAEVISLKETEESTNKSARELESAQKKLADAENKLAEAQKSGSATAIYKARQEVNRLKGNGPQDTGSSFGNIKQTIQAEVTFDQIKVDEATLHTLLKDAIQNGIDGMDLQLASLSKQIADGIDVPDEKWQSILDQYNQLREQIGQDPIVIDFKTGGIEKVESDAQATAKSMGQAASAISSVGSALQSIEDPSAKVMGIIAQAIATMVQAFSSALASDTTTKTNIWAFIGASAASMAAMATAISQIHSATGYANGGIVDGRAGGFVGGTSYSGDNVGNVRLDSGELVLNRAQQSNLATNLQQNGGGKMEIVGVLTGENVVLMADRWGRRTGRGELLFGKNL